MGDKKTHTILESIPAAKAKFLNQPSLFLKPNHLKGIVFWYIGIKCQRLLYLSLRAGIPVKFRIAQYV